MQKMTYIFSYLAREEGMRYRFKGYLMGKRQVKKLY